ncbi:periplasmic heavy metal sensor [Phaeocystidibacter luteus]|uniref:Periplasmic heavy metal sensor n=1 Tax=Phaeocystidibacter luteus TaxID=911197 RepID=A0A6N6RMP7_9FLAO|nr:periplasmic heavy metal sensor [Phaeocystidibacter luteus]KAB2814860.1 periplasmic heavy metal sensor [Phaeocystidibacter luteus]
MKSLLLTCFAFLAFSYTAFAQPQGRGERLEALRTAYITQEVNLTSAEAEKFWPIHNEMSEELKETREERHQLLRRYRSSSSIENADSDDLKEMMERFFELEAEELAIRKKYHTRFLEVLSAQKVALIYRAEEEFKRELLRRVGREGGREGGRSEGRRE